LQIGASGIGATVWHTAGAIIIISKISAITPRIAGPREGGQSVSTAEAEAIQQIATGLGTTGSQMRAQTQGGRDLAGTAVQAMAIRGVKTRA
jgi:hypothetical protein